MQNAKAVDNHNSALKKPQFPPILCVVAEATAMGDGSNHMEGLMAKDMPTFQKIDVDSLDSAQYEAFIAYLKAKSAFRGALQSIAPDGYKVVFTEKYGTVDKPGDAQLKVALVKAGSSKPKSDAKSLSQFLAEQAANGGRA